MFVNNCPPFIGLCSVSHAVGGLLIINIKKNKKNKLQSKKRKFFLIPTCRIERFKNSFILASLVFDSEVYHYLYFILASLVSTINVCNFINSLTFDIQYFSSCKQNTDNLVFNCKSS